ncbi:hypothetical protein [Streptomyces tardus]|uniref:hypothetical protein n=1 Tax=Streptomyces tardus TaxID=2780544 RepID=UPI003558670D
MNIHSGAERPPSGLPPELAAALRTGPFHEALRTAIAVRGLALSRLRHRLGQRGVRIGVTTLSYWQQGLRRPARAESLRALPALEEVLEVPPGSLVALLQTDRSGGAPAARPYRALMESPEPLNEMLADLGSSAEAGVHTVCQIDRITVGARRELLGRQSQHLLRAHRDGVDRYLAIYVGDPGCEVERVRVRETENCRAGYVRSDGGTGIVVAELLFDGRLRAGETRLISYRFEDGTAGESREYIRGFSYSGGQYVLQVGFDPAELPARCHRFARRAVGGPDTGRTELLLSGRYPTVHLAEQQVESGQLGIDWEWA